MQPKNEDKTEIKEKAMAKKMDIFLRLMNENFKKAQPLKAKKMLGVN